MKAKLILLLSVTCLFSSVSTALNPVSPSHTIDILKIDNRFPDEARVEVYVNEDVSNPNNECTSSARYAFPHSKDNPASSLMFSMLLAAKASDKKIEIFTEGCFDNNPLIKVIQIL